MVIHPTDIETYHSNVNLVVVLKGKVWGSFKMY